MYQSIGILEKIFSLDFGKAFKKHALLVLFLPF